MLELLIGTVIVGIMAVVLSDFYVNRLIDYARSETLLILQANTKQALETASRDLRAASSIEAVNQWADPNGPSGNPFGWSSNNASPSVLVLAVPAHDTNGELIFADPAHTVLKTNDVIYFVDGAKKTLYRRTLANPDPGNAAKTTCPPAVASAACPADAKVIEDVANITAAYFDVNNTPIVTPSLAHSVGMTLTQKRTRFGREYQNSLTSRTTLRNK
ncbi:MAG TPA: hypothetical protein VNA68_03315 [Candidatus Dormibacteraeota bacterium]|nr:hypothetical protein [Candidatus Dormibacteraeota bacterium]